MEWTKEYYGITHLGEFNLRKMRVSVERLGNRAILQKWFPGCGFRPKEIPFQSFEKAKKAGEKVMKNWE